MNEEEKKALKVINARKRRLLDELGIEKEDMSDEPKIAYLMQEIRANKTLLNLIEKLQTENEELKEFGRRFVYVTDKERDEKLVLKLSFKRSNSKALFVIPENSIVYIEFELFDEE